MLAELQRIAATASNRHARVYSGPWPSFHVRSELLLDLFGGEGAKHLQRHADRRPAADIPAGWDAKVRCLLHHGHQDPRREGRRRTDLAGSDARDRYPPGTDAIALGLSGPALRGSGVARDIRKDEPYAAYADFEFDIPVGSAGDTYDRYLVRMEELRQSLRIVRQALDGLPEGPIVGRVPRLIKPPAGETYHAIESPKGELGFFIASDGKSNAPYRFRVRPPSFCNLQALPRLVKGHLVADVVALIGSIDVVLGEVDR